MSDTKLLVSLSPHGSTSARTAQVMWLVVLALMPAVVASVLVFGVGVLLLYAVSVACCLGTEYLILGFRHRKKNAAPFARGTGSIQSPGSISDGSAVVTGLLLAMNVSASLPWWQLAVGAVFSIGVGKMVFGGLGNNPFNPALAGRAFLLASFPAEMTTFPKPSWGTAADALSAATPLTGFKEGMARGLSFDQLAMPGYGDLLLGLRGGCLGEVSVVAIVAGAIILFAFRVISWELPVFFLAGLGVMTGSMWIADPARYLNPLYHILSGGAFLAAVFMITDMVTSPMTPRGKMIYALSAGILAGLIRLFGSYPEGASYAILFMNALVPLIDRAFRPKRFGRGKPVVEPGTGKAAS